MDGGGGGGKAVTLGKKYKIQGIFSENFHTCVWLIFRFLIKISTLNENYIFWQFHFWPKFWFLKKLQLLTNITIFDQYFDFCSRFLHIFFLTNFSIFEATLLTDYFVKNFLFRQVSIFQPNFEFWLKLSIFGQNFDFLIKNFLI